LSEYLSLKGKKQGQQRIDVLRIFLSSEGHFTSEELHILVKRKKPGIGIATVYRKLKLLCECGLARELVFDGRSTRCEHNYNHTHHDHLICTRCGSVQEVLDSEIERLQNLLVKKTILNQ
jgi:Fur family ferric uptake transcriptional regulator